MEQVEASLSISLDVYCPACKHCFNLLTNDSGELLHQVIADDSWKIEAQERLKCNVTCPECKVEFKVKGIIW